MKNFIGVVYGLIGQRRGLFVDQRIIEKLKGNNFVNIVDEIYDIFFKLI